jgi:hypothetical protein
MPRLRKYPDVLRERAVRLVFEHYAARGMRLVMPRRWLCRAREDGSDVVRGSW